MTIRNSETVQLHMNYYWCGIGPTNLWFTDRVIATALQCGDASSARLYRFPGLFLNKIAITESLSVELIFSVISIIANWDKWNALYEA